MLETIFFWHWTSDHQKNSADFLQKHFVFVGKVKGHMLCKVSCVNMQYTVVSQREGDFTNY